MAAHKGHEKAGGREPGAKNKIGSEVKVRLTEIVAKYVLTTDGIRNMESDLSVMRPAERIATIEKLMKYVLPTLGSVSVKGENDGEPVKITVSYSSAKPTTDDDDAGEKDYSIKI